MELTGPCEPAILVVDDEESFVASLTHALGLEGYRVLTANDGPSGLESALRHRPDVVLLDLMLPGMPGLEVCRAIRDAGGAQPGIIMVTAKSSDVDAVVGLESGADDYVAKPFSLSLLLARVRALLRRTRRMASQADGAGPAAMHRLTVGQLVVDPDAYEATWAGRPLDLSPRLFGLLVYLVRHQNRVVTRDTLLEQVWGYAYTGETRTVDVHVHWLREVLDGVGAGGELIQTVRGVGYKFVVQGGDGTCG